MIHVAKYDLEGNFLEEIQVKNYTELCKLHNLNPVDYSSALKKVK